MTRKLGLLVAALACVFVAGGVMAADEAAGGYQQAEDNFVGAMKNIEVSDDGAINMDFGGELRGRVENWNNFGWGGSGSRSDTFSLWRALIYNDIRVGENIRVYGEMISALITDRNLPGGSTTGLVNSIDLHQAYADFTTSLTDSTDATFRVGRQTYLFGKGRLVGPKFWANTKRQWDGFTMMAQGEDWNVTGFWSQFVPTDKYDFDRSDAGEQFFGVYATGEKKLFEHGMDLYVLGRHFDALDGGGDNGEERRYTAGGRVFGKIDESPVDFDLEGGYQFGDLSTDGSIEAYFFAAEAGYAWEGAEGKPRMFVGFDYASGDKDSDGTGPGGKTFHPLYPLGHKYFGCIDVIGRRNIIDVNMGVTIKPVKKLTLMAAGYFFWKAEENDAIYNAGNGVIRRGPTASNEIGAEIDLTAKYKLSKRWTAMAGYSHFFAGDAVTESIPNEPNAGDYGDGDIDYAFIQLQCNF